MKVLKKQLSRLPWFLLEEYTNWPPLALYDFIEQRAALFKEISGHYLNSALLYEGDKAYTCFEGGSFLRNKKYLFKKLLRDVCYFEHWYAKGQVSIRKAQILLRKAIVKIKANANPKGWSLFLKELQAVMIEIALVGQPMNIIEFQDAWFTNYLKRSLTTHQKVSNLPIRAEAFARLTNPFLESTEKYYKKFSIDKKYQRLFNFARQIMISKDQRYKVFLRYKEMLEKLATRIAEHKGFNSLHVVNLNFDEFIDFVRDNRVPKDIQRRANKWGVVFYNGHAYSIDNILYRSIYRKISTIAQKQVNILKGQCAMPGVVSGKIIVVNAKEDIVKMMRGAILISHTTTVDLMPAVRKAAAIVTDMGGITSHASIVSRELGIPCVIGTKIATKVFKDGDRVEVDAAKGIVRKL